MHVISILWEKMHGVTHIKTVSFSFDTCRFQVIHCTCHQNKMEVNIIEHSGKNTHSWV
jgi:hypothetical protein